MKKTTFYGLAIFCGLGSLCVLVVGLACLDTGVGKGEKLTRVKHDLMSVGSAMKIYELNAGRPPTTAQGLDALVNEPTTGPKPKRWTLIMRRVPLDPWLTPYRYALLAPREREWRWELRCAGPDGVFDNRDDLVREEESGGPLTLQQGSTESRPSY